MLSSSDPMDEACEWSQIYPSRGKVVEYQLSPVLDWLWGQKPPGVVAF